MIVLTFITLVIVASTLSLCSDRAESSPKLPPLVQSVLLLRGIPTGIFI